MRNTQMVEEMCRVMVENNSSVVIAGNTGVGKNTLLDQMQAYIPQDRRIVALADALIPYNEFSKDTDETYADYADGAMTTLIRKSFQQSPSFVIVDELRGSEVAALLELPETTSFMTTIHCMSTAAIPTRLVNMVASKLEPTVSYEALLEQVYEVLDYGIYIERYTHNGADIRYIKEISVYADGVSESIVQQRVVDGDVVLVSN